MPVPIERLAWDQREAHVNQMAAIRRAYENDGSRLPAATERIRELRRELRAWKAAVVILAGLVAFELIGLCSFFLESSK